MYCGKCGTKNLEDSKYCECCGEKIKEVTKEKTKEVIKDSKLNSIDSNELDKNVIIKSVENKQAEVSKHKNYIWLFISGGILLLIIAIVLLIFMYRGLFSTNNKEEKIQISQNVTLSYDTINQNELDEKYVLTDVKLSQNEIIIKGTEDEIDEVKIVKALIDLSVSDNKIGTQTINDLPLKAYDAEGNIVDVEFVPSKISAEITINSFSKTVKLNFIPKGTLAHGKSISEYYFSSNEVTIYGDEQTLSSIDAIDIEVDVSGLSSDTSFKVELKNPTGIKSMSVNNVVINLVITDTSSEKIMVNVPLQIENLDQGLVVQAIDSENSYVTVEVQGASSVLSSINSNDIIAYIDLTGYNKPGTYDLEIKIKGTNPLLIYRPTKPHANIVIDQKN